CEIGLGAITNCRVSRKPCGHLDAGAGTQEGQGGLVADLDPPSGDHRHAPAQVGGLAPLLVIERRTFRTQAVVKEMHLAERPAADVALPAPAQLRKRHRGSRHLLWRAVDLGAVEDLAVALLVAP